MMRWLTALLLCTSAAYAEGERAGDFDYYVVSLSWTPNWCRLEGDARGSPQCDPDQEYGFTLHGLWPQYEDGWPSFCPTTERMPTRGLTATMVDIMGSSGLAWHQWRKHGVCTGLPVAAYYDLSRDAYGRIARPDLLRQVSQSLRLPARVIEEAFLEANPQLGPDMLTVTCREGHVQEVRICLTQTLEPRDCGADVVRDCTLQEAIFEPMR